MQELNQECAFVSLAASMLKQIILASNNTGKIAEFQHIFAELSIHIIPQREFNVPEVDEPYHTFIENALHKARHCSRLSGLPTLADDSGICVNALNGRPGVFSARYSGDPKNDNNNNQKLIQELSNFSDKSAYYYCVLVLVRSPEDPQPIIADGRLCGTIVDSPKGVNGFGYDPHFYIEHLGKTVAELDKTKKNEISHRKMAINELIKQMGF